MSPRTAIVTTTVGFLLLYAVLAGVATATNSLYGEFGWLVLGCVLAAFLLVERALHREAPAGAVRAAGLAAVPDRTGIAAGLAVASLLIAAVIGLAASLPHPAAWKPTWPIMAAGLLLQGGVAEEVVFRGYLFRRIREGRRFWAAAWVSMVPFVLAHAYMFFTMGAMVAAAALLVAASTTFPLAKLFELSGRSIWPCALVHGATHSIKFLDIPEERFATTQLLWMGVVMVAPWAVFVLRSEERGSDSTG